MKVNSYRRVATAALIIILVYVYKRKFHYRLYLEQTILKEFWLRPSLSASEILSGHRLLIQPTTLTNNSQTSILNSIRSGNIKILHKEVNHKDFANAELIMPSLARSFRCDYDTSSDPVLILDIGANIGESSALFMDLFTPSDCLQLLISLPAELDKSLEHNERNCPQTCARVVAVEAQRSNYEALVRRGKTEKWTEVGWTVIHAAVTNRTESGGRFYGYSTPGVQDASLDYRGVGAWADLELVDLVTIDNILTNVSSGGEPSPAFLIKIDIEGFDGVALRGAQETLERQRVKWVVFEYNKSWRYNVGESLEKSSQYMYSLGYECYLVVPSAGLVPLFPPFWDRAFETWRWSNVLCGRAEDRDVVALVEFMTEGDRPSLQEFVSWKKLAYAAAQY